jgi:hypothetical protein
MTAQSIDRPRKPTTITRRPRKGSKAEAILTLSATTPATPIEIAESIHTCPSHVTQTLQRYGVTPNRLDSYKKNRADIMAGMQLKILKYVNDDSLKKASVNNLAYSLAQFNTIERLERGQTTGNVGVGIALSEPMQAAVDRIISRAQPIIENKV